MFTLLVQFCAFCAVFLSTMLWPIPMGQAGHWAASDAAALVCGSPPEFPEINQSVTRREGAPTKPVEIVVDTRASSSPCTPTGELSRPIRLRSAEVDEVCPNRNPGADPWLEPEVPVRVPLNPGSFGRDVLLVQDRVRSRGAAVRPLQRLEGLPETSIVDERVLDLLGLSNRGR